MSSSEYSGNYYYYYYDDDDDDDDTDGGDTIRNSNRCQSCTLIEGISRILT